jgi:hypothetical protein
VTQSFKGQLSGESADRELDRRQNDEGFQGRCEALPVLGEASVASKPREGPLDDRPARQRHEAFLVVASLDDFGAQRRNHGDRRGNLVSVVAVVGPDELQPGKAVEEFVEHERGAISVLHAGVVDDDAQRPALHVDQRVNLAALDLLADVVAGQAVMTAPFSADFNDWLSMIAAVGLASWCQTNAPPPSSRRSGPFLRPTDARTGWHRNTRP